MVLRRLNTSGGSEIVVFSASLMATVALTTGFALVLYQRARDRRRDDESSRKATSVTGTAFSAQEWHRLAQNGSGGGGGGEGGGYPHKEGDVPQKPVAHPTIAETGGRKSEKSETLALVMVGVPGRGKTSVAMRTSRYLSFFHGVDCRVFNVGDRRRQHARYLQHETYDVNDADATRRRKLFSDQTLDELKLFLLEPGRTAIFDASNVTSDRRLEVYSEIKKLGKVDVIFVEIMSQETMIFEEEMAEQDLVDAAPLDIAEDYRKRVQHYQEVYEPIASGGDDDHERDYSYIKCIDRGKQIVMNRIEGYMPGRIAQFITNCCHCHWTTSKKLYLSRHGQSQYNATGRIGGDSDLTDMGERYALALRDFASSDVCVDAQTGVAVPARLWTSTLKRTRNTARHITQ